MAYLFRALIFLVVIIATVQCLTCKLCIIGISDNCMVEGNVTCDEQTFSCFYGTTNLTGTGTVSVRNAGCVEKSFCGTNQTGSILNIEYAASFKCCTTDLCNDASSLQLSLMVALCFGAVTSVWLML